MVDNTSKGGNFNPPRIIGVTKDIYTKTIIFYENSYWKENIGWKKGYKKSIQYHFENK